MSVQLVALLVNVGLAVLKFIVGSIANSYALLADAFNSAGDVVATLVAWLAFRYGQRPADENHHYGHQNAEVVAGLLIGGMLIATGAFISIDGVLAVAKGHERPVPGTLAIWAAGLTAVIKEALYRVSMRVGTAISSPTLLASARDHRADVLTALVALLAVALSQLGAPEIDSYAACLVGLWVLRLGVQPLRANLGILMHEAPPALAAEAREAVGALADVVVSQLRVQPIGGRYRMDMTIEVDGELTVRRAHEIAHETEERIRARLDQVTEVHVHVEPTSGSPPPA